MHYSYITIFLDRVTNKLFIIKEACSFITAHLFPFLRTLLKYLKIFDLLNKN